MVSSGRNWAKRLEELSALGSPYSFGCETEEQAKMFEESIVTFRISLNDLE